MTGIRVDQSGRRWTEKWEAEIEDAGFCSKGSSVEGDGEKSYMLALHLVWPDNRISDICFFSMEWKASHEYDLVNELVKPDHVFSANLECFLGTRCL